jgi:hypothetical protein
MHTHGLVQADRKSSQPQNNSCCAAATKRGRHAAAETEGRGKETVIGKRLVARRLDEMTW